MSFKHRATMLCFASSSAVLCRHGISSQALIFRKPSPLTIRRYARACISTPASIPEDHVPEYAEPDLRVCDDTPAQRNDEFTADRKLLMRLATPSYIAQASDPVAALVDLFWIGRLGPLPLAGAAVASAAFNTVAYLFGLLSFSSNAIVARAIAVSKRAPEESAKRIARAVASCIVLAFYLGVVVATPIVAFAPQFVRLMGAKGVVVNDAIGYLRARAVGMPFVIMFFAMSGVFRGLADLSRPLYASVVGNVVNIVLDPLLMFAPLAWGCFGAGLATSIAAFVSVAYLVLYLVRTGIVPASSWPSAFCVPRSDIAQIFGPLVALSSKRVMENGILAVACAQAARIGPASSAAMEIGRQVWWSIGILWWPLCIALSAIISIAVAENSDKSRIKNIAGLTFKITAALGVLGGLGTYLYSAKIPLLFVQDPAFISSAAEGLRFLAPLLTISSMMDVLDASLIASGDGVFNTCTTSFAAAVCAISLARGNITSVGAIWLALSCSYLLRLVMNTLRFIALFGRKALNST